MATALLSPNAKQQFLTAAGAPAAGYKLYTYATGTTTPQATYTNRAGTVANANPIVLDARGEAIVYLTPGVVYDYVLKSAADVTEWSRAGVSALAGDSTAVEFEDAVAPAFLKTVSDILAGQPVSLTRNIDRTKHADLRAGTLTDDLTGAATDLMTAMAATGYGHLVLGRGEHRFASTLTVPAGITITGEGAHPYTGANGAATPRGKGTWLHFDHAGVGINVYGQPAASSTTIRGIGTRRTHAAPGVGWTPTVYDYDFLVQGVETFLDDVVLLNAYKGVKIADSGYGKLWTNRLRGQCFAEGLNLQQSFDTCRIRDTHLWPYWSQQADVIAWQLANTKALRIARADNSSVSGFFSIYHNRGIEVYGTADGTAYKLRLTDVDLDIGYDGIVFETTAVGATVLMTNVVTLGKELATGNRGVRVLGNNNTIRAANLDVALVGRDGIRIDGTGNAMNVVNATVRDYNKDAVGASAYEVAAGNTLEFSGRPVATGGGAGPMFGAVAGVYKADLGAGVGSGTTNGSGDLVVTHGLGTTPSAVYASGIGTGSLQYSVQAVTSTTFTVRVYDAAGAPAATTAVNINWHAKKF